MYRELQCLFSSSVVVCIADEAMWHLPLYPEEQIYAQAMVAKRRAEFQAGRACARQVLAELGVHAFPLLRNEHRVPLWPMGVVGSIAHCDDLCWAAAASTNALLGLGVDVESAQAEINFPAELICVAEELVDVPDPLVRSDWLRLLFSAKESVIKAYYSLAQSNINFLDICLSLDESDQSIQVQWLRDGQVPIHWFSGRYLMTESHIFTVVEIKSVQ